MKKTFMLISVLFLSGAISPLFSETGQNPGKNIYSFTMKTIGGQDQSLADFKGKALLIVNTASRCGYTPQYKGLEVLYEKYKNQGFEILAFPANNFKNQEPAGDAEIKKFCELNYSVTFPLFSKISVKGRDMHPLYRYLTQVQGFEGDITWNFNKFLIDPQGRVVARFGSKTEPLSKELTEKIDQILPPK